MGEIPPRRLSDEELFEKFADQLDAFFDKNPEIDWVAVSDQSEAIIYSGLDNEILMPVERAQWESENGELLIIFGRAMIAGEF